MPTMVVAFCRLDACCDSEALIFDCIILGFDWIILLAFDFYLCRK